jgi:hypothetical protein
VSSLDAMTSATLAPPLPVGARALGWLAVAGTLPYVVLKLLWLAGSTVGTSDAAFLADPAVHAMNIVTLGMDLVVVALALALTHRWGDRLPAWLVLLPMWVGTGFLVPMAVSIMPGTVAEIALDGASGGPLLPWVQPMVYGGFAWQGVFLCAAFVVHARRRWGALVTAPAVPSPETLSVLRVIAGGGTVMAALSAGLHLAIGLTGGDVIGLAVETVNAALAVAGAAGVLALVRGTGRWPAAVAGWTGSAAMFSWGLYGTTTAVAVTQLAGHAPASALAQLTGLLGGFALATAGLLALTGRGTTH